MGTSSRHLRDPLDGSERSGEPGDAEQASNPWDKLPDEARGEIFKRMPHQHWVRAARVCCSFREYYVSALQRERSALNKHVLSMGRELVGMIRRVMRDMVRTLRDPPVRRPNGCIEVGSQRASGEGHRPVSGEVRGHFHDANTAAVAVSGGGANFSVYLERTRVNTYQATDQVFRFETWSLHISGVSLKAIGVALDLARELQNCRSVAGVKFAQVTVCMPRAEAPLKAHDASAFCRSLTVLLHELRVPISDEQLAMLVAGRWSMWSTNQACCTYL